MKSALPWLDQAAKGKHMKAQDYFRPHETWIILSESLKDKTDLILAFWGTDLSPLNISPSLCYVPASPSFLSAGVSLVKCLIVRCQIFTGMRGEDPPAVLISCNAFLSSALITVGDRVMLPAISFVSCRKCSVSLSSVFHGLVLS